MRKLRVLLIEPDDILAESYRQLLSVRYDVSVARDAQSAISMADTTTPDLVILEPLLPEHNGAEFLYEFRSYGEWQTIPVALLSRLPARHLKLDDTVKGSLGIVKHWYKPKCNISKLPELVAGIIGDSA